MSSKRKESFKNQGIINNVHHCKKDKNNEVWAGPLYFTRRVARDRAAVRGPTLLCVRITWEAAWLPTPWLCPRRVKSQSLGLGSWHSCFLKVPRWFQCAATFENHDLRVSNFKTESRGSSSFDRDWSRESRGIQKKKKRERNTKHRF